jgi:hypothetical protein
MNFIIRFPSNATSQVSEAQFPDFPLEAWDLLHEFIAFSNEAHKTRFARELGSYKPSFHFSNSGPIRNVGVVPDDEALSTFLLKYRPILLKKERTEFTRICNLLTRHVNHPSFTTMMKEIRDEYSGKALRLLCEFETDGVQLISQTFLESYLNAFEYHRDLQWRQKLEKFSMLFESNAKRGLVTLLLIYKFSAVSRLRNIIRDLERIKDEHNT